MNVDLLVTLSRIFLALGIALSLIAIVIYVKLDIYKAWHIVTGRRIKEQTVRIGKKDSTVKNSQRIATEKIRQRVLSAKPGSNLKKTYVKEETDKLETREKAAFANEEEKRSIMEQIPETVPLKGIRMKYDVTFIHTQIKI